MQDQEKELKLLITQNQAEKLLQQLPIDQCRLQTNTYYDTKERALRQKANALRIRKLEDGQCILTIKKPLNATTKYEYERPVQSDTLQGLNEEEKEWVQEHLEEVSLKELEPFVQFKTKRCICELPDAEVSIDHTKFENHDDYEIEYEYRKGHENHDGITQFNQILKPLGLHWEKNGLTKLARAIEDKKGSLFA